MEHYEQAEMKSSAGKKLMLKGVKATGSINGRLLSMLLIQSFKNESKKNTEITYTFPIPYGAVLLGVEVDLNGRRLTGKVTAKEDASEAYEEALSEGNSAILIGRNEDFTYTLELGNLLPNETCEISIRYAQVLSLAHGQMRMILPTAIAPRYGNPLTQTTLSPHQITETDIAAEYPFEISLQVFGSLADSNISSPSHVTSYSRGENQLTISLSRTGAMDRDFVLILSDLKNNSVGIASADANVPGQTIVMASFNPTIEGISPLPVAVKILLDCSGSMAGESIDAAKVALRDFVLGLKNEDRFSLSKFGSEFEHRSRGMWRGTKPAQASALRWIDEVEADMGGTEMWDALHSTLVLAQGEKIDVLLITDGEIHGIKSVIEMAKKAGQRIFVVAIGSSPAEPHLQRLANATGGLCDYILPGEAVGPAIRRMHARLRFPRLGQLAVEVPAEWSDVVAGELPTFAYSDDTVTTYLKVAADPNALAGSIIKLTGQIASETQVKTLCTLLVDEASIESNITARMAAQGEYLEAMNGLAKDTEKAKRLAIAYQLVTDQTNFILVHEREDGEKAQDMPTGYKVPQMAVAGASGLGSTRLSNKTPAKTSSPFPRSASMMPSSMRKTAPPTKMPVSYAMPRSMSMAMSDDDFEEVDKTDSKFWFSGRADQLTQSVTRLTEGDEDDLLEEFDLESYAGLTPAGVVEWLTINRAKNWPETIEALGEIGVSLQIREWLEFSVADGSSVRTAVLAFLAVMTDVSFIQSCDIPLHQENIDSLNARTARWGSRIKGEAIESMMGSVRSLLSGMKPDRWPDSVLYLHESSAVGSDQ